VRFERTASGGWAIHGIDQEAALPLRAALEEGWDVAVELRITTDLASDYGDGVACVITMENHSGHPLGTDETAPRIESWIKGWVLGKLGAEV
jgi:hypothetical protein